MKRKLIASIMSLTLAAGMLAGCGGSTEEPTTGTDTGSGDSASYTIGISQFAEHPALDNCREGFLEALAEEGIVEGENLIVEYENAQADMAVATQIAQNFVTRKVSLVYAIATPSAQAAFNAAGGTGIPTVFGAITDPIVAGLANEDGTPAGEITGVSDALPVDVQLKMVKEIMPDAKKIGIIYTTSEANSEVQMEQYKSLVSEFGLELEVAGVNTIADIPGATDALIAKKVDAFVNLTDNTVVSALSTILAKTNAAGIPVFGSEIEQVKAGCISAQGIEYFDLGKRAGRMAAKILKGEKASSMNFEAVTETELYLNDKAIKDLGIEIPASARDRAAQVFTEIESK